MNRAYSEESMRQSAFLSVTLLLFVFRLKIAVLYKRMNM